MRITKIAAATALFFCLAAVPSLAAPPAISDVSLRGLQIGGTTVITVRGNNLLPAPRLLVPGVGMEATARDGATAQQIDFEVTVDPAATPGTYPLWLANAEGVSNSVAMAVDALPETAYSERIESLPVALHGRVEGATILKTAFAGKAGMRVVVELESRRLGSNLKPVVRLLNSRGTQIAWGPSLDRLSGDCLCEAILEDDGDYSIQIHDVLYRGEAPGYFRLKIGDLPQADLAYPMGIQRGASADVRLLRGNLAGHQQHVTAPADWLASEMPIVPAIDGYSGVIPRIAVGPNPELLETAPAEGLQALPAPPLAISGRLQQAREEDQFLLSVEPKSRLRLEVFAERAGSPLDGVLLVRAEDGRELARGDDQPGSPDPAVDFTVPDGVTKIVLVVQDLLRRGGDSFAYRLLVRDLARPAFDLTVDADRATVAQGGGQLLRVNVQRSGFGGPIDLRVEGLPDGLEVSGQRIAAGNNVALLALHTTAEPHPATWRIVGTAVNDESLQAIALVPDAYRSQTRPWFREHLAVAGAPPSPVAIAWQPASDAALVRGALLPAAVSLTRGEGVQGKVRIRLLTTQPMPRKKIKENNEEKEVDDVERALRLQSEPILEAGMSETTAMIVAPADLPQHPWGLILAAELLSADEKSVVATAYTRSQLLPTQPPLRLELAGPNQIEAKAGGGDTGKLLGKVVRADGVAAAVTLSLTGLPKEYPSPKLELAANQVDFTFPIAFPYGVAAGELKNVTLTAEAQLPGGSAAGNEVPVDIRVVPGEKPAMEMPLTIFEDNPEFVQQLAKGDGQASLDEEQKYSGKASVKVTPGQRFNESLPGLPVAIRENPGPGEYRYLRFAWRKVGGESICLQLNHDGKWGPGGSGKEGARFRYHAGPGGECYGASLALDEQLPGEFVVLTRDLFADFGEFTLNGIALSPVNGEYALFDHIYLGKSPADFELVAPKPE
jgi:hypothetical protein